MPDEAQHCLDLNRSYIGERVGRIMGVPAGDIWANIEDQQYVISLGPDRIALEPIPREGTSRSRRLVACAKALHRAIRKARLDLHANGHKYRRGQGASAKEDREKLNGTRSRSSAEV